MSTNRLHRDIVHPKTEPTRPVSMGRFQKTDNVGHSRVADMVMAFNAKSGGDQKPSGVKITLKRTCSAGSVSLGSPQSEGGGLVHRSCGTYQRGSGRRRSDEPSDANLCQRNSLQDGEFLHGAVVLNGDQSGDDSEEESEIDIHRTMQKKYLTQSLGRNEFRNVIPRGSMAAGKQGGVQQGKLVDNPSEEESDDDIEVDERVQKTFAHFKRGTLERPVAIVTKPQAKSQVIKPIGVTATGGYNPSGKGPSFKRTSSPRLQESSVSPKHSYGRTSSSSSRLRMASAADPLERTPSPRDGVSPGRSKIESNPFFQKDRLNHSKSRVAALQAQERRSSAPSTSAPKQSTVNAATGMGTKKMVRDAISKSTDELAKPTDRSTPNRGLSPGRRDYRSSSPSWKSSSPETTPAHSPARESVGIQMRIKLWADKEKEAMAQLQKSPSPPARNVQKKESTKRSSQLEMTQKLIPGKTANSTEDSEPAQTETDDIYDDIVVQTVPHSTNVISKREDVGEQASSPEEPGNEDEYEDIVTSSDVKHLAPALSAEDGLYDDVEAPTKSRVPLPSARRKSSGASAVAENSESVYEEDLYATIPGEIYENPLEESEEVPPELPPRPDHFRGIVSSETAAVANGVIYELEDEIYEDPEATENSPNVSKTGSPPSPVKGEKLSSTKGKNKIRIQSDKEMSPKPSRSKWSQIFSPVLSRRRKMEERSNSLLDEREQEEGRTEAEGKQQRIAGRSSKKRAAIRKKRSTNTDSFDSLTDGAGAGTESDERTLDSENENTECDDVFASKSSPSAQQLQTELKSSESPCNMNEESYVSVADKKLDPQSGRFIISPLESSEASDKPSQAAEGKGVCEGAASSKPTKKKLRKNRTLSREIYDIINSMGTEGHIGISTICEDYTEEHTSRTPPERNSALLLMSSNLSAPAEMRSFHSDSALNVSSTRPSGDCGLNAPLLVVPYDRRRRSSSSPQPIQRGAMFDMSGDSSSDVEPNAPTYDEESATQSSLDRGETRLNRKRLRMRSELCEGNPSRTVVSTSFKEKYLTSPVMRRNNSLSPSEEVSLWVCGCVGVWVCGYVCVCMHTCKQVAVCMCVCMCV